MQIFKRLYLSHLTIRFLSFSLLFSFFFFAEGCRKPAIAKSQKNATTSKSAFDLPKDTLINDFKETKDTLTLSSLPSKETIPTELDSINILQNDSSIIDTLSTANIPIDSIPPPLKEGQIDEEIEYSAKDSIVFLGNGTGFLHNSGEIKYKDINLKADFMRIKMDSSVIYASGVRDSIGDLQGTPVFGEGESTYDSKEITYNLKTKKGLVTGAITQEGEAYIVSEKVKKTADEYIAIGNTKYTTCDNHEHPHFYLRIKKGKIKPKSHIVCGPANLVLADVPLPLYLPFGFFPFSTSYSSGFLMPTYSDELNRGLGLINGGYYLAFNDYLDLELRSEIYTKGTWAVSANSNYLKRYKFRGNIGINYREDITGEKDLPNYNKANSFSVRWSHSQDAKKNPSRTFSANVNFSTSGYNRNNINTYARPEINSQNTKSSSISFSQRFPSLPNLSLSGGMQVSQRTSDSTINMDLPNLSISVSRLYPLKRKKALGKERFYEKISLSYSGNIANSIHTKEDKLLSSSFVRDWRNGMKHSIPVSASFNFFNYINVTPTFNYNERWHLQKIKQRYDKEKQVVVKDTINKFNRNYDFSMGVSAQTKLYGFYIPIRSIFGDKVDRIRHVVTPNIGFSYRPDFSEPMWGNYDTYIKENASDGSSEEIKYSIYDGTFYGGPPKGKSGNINFSIANNLEMKIRNDKDTTGKVPFKKKSLIDNFSLSTSYNLMADSMNLSLINTNLRLKLGQNRSINLSGSFDPYIFELDTKGMPRRVNKIAWNNGRFPRFLGTNISHSLTINNDTFKKLFGKKTKEDTQEDNFIDPNNPNNPNDPHFMGDGLNENIGLNGNPEDKLRNKKKKVDYDEDNYEKIKIPFSINLNYSVAYRPSSDIKDFLYDKMRYKMLLVHNLSLSGNIKFTENWNVSSSTSYDFKAKEFTQLSVNVTRNLHCWTMTASFVPFGYYKSYNFRIGVNASMLSDLKYEKQNRRDSSPPVDWY